MTLGVAWQPPGIIAPVGRTRHQALARRAGLRPGRPDGEDVFNILATFAEFEVGLLRMRTRQGMAVAKAKSKLRGKQPKLSPQQQAELQRMHATGDYSIADVTELFSIGRATVYRTLQRNRRSSKPWCPASRLLCPSGQLRESRAQPRLTLTLAGQ